MNVNKNCYIYMVYVHTFVYNYLATFLIYCKPASSMHIESNDLEDKITWQASIYATRWTTHVPFNTLYVCGAAKLNLSNTTIIKIYNHNTKKYI